MLLTGVAFTVFFFTAFATIWDAAFCTFKIDVAAVQMVQTYHISIMQSRNQILLHI